MELKKGCHSVTRLAYHFTFIPKYRKRKLTGEIKKRLEGMIKFCAQVNDWKVMELDIQPDHVHLLLQANAVDSPSSIMKRIKGGTSKKLREYFPGLTETIWMKSFWAGGYFAETVG
ncbi:IS200/IS605 family transposase, partial [Candidatus Beckwithbacteria bacterium CG10_big_fil_rev_8_21_14_0_10_34_10]